MILRATTHPVLLLALALPAQAPMSSKPIVLDAPIGRWDEGAPLGGGRLGAMLWGEANVLRVSLDRADLWDLRVAEATTSRDWTWATLQRLVADKDAKQIAATFDAPYAKSAHPTKLPPLRLELEFPAASCHLRSVRLDLERGEAVADLGAATVRVCVPVDGLAVRIEVEGAVPTRVALLDNKALSGLGYESVAAATGTARAYRLAEGGAFAVHVAQVPRDGGASLAAALVTGNDGGDPAAGAARLAEAAARKAWDQTLAQSAARWARYWQTSSVRLPNAALQAQYDLARYLYFAGSCEGGLPLARQGLWTADDGKPPAAKGEYRHDLATEATYLAYHPLGAEGVGLPLADWLWQLAPRFRRFAHEFYGVSGLVVPGATALDGAPLGGPPMHSLAPIHTAWLAHGLWLHWRYTQNRAFLESVAYPWARDAGKALQALLVAAPGGKLRLPLSSSPEWLGDKLDAFLPPDSNYDQALLRWMFGALATMARELAETGDEARWAAVLPRLETLEVDPKTKGLLVARGVPYSESHRHLSHLIAIHPLGLLDANTAPEEQRTVFASLAEIEARGTKGFVGSTFAWQAALYARAGLGDQALESLVTFQRAFTSRNGLHVGGDQSGTGISRFSHRSVTVDGNFLALDAIHEMLLQSFGGIVRVFPAVPTRWKDVEFTELRAEGAFRVSAERRDGKTVSIRVRAEKGGTLRLLDPFPGREAEWELPPGVKPRYRPGAGYELDLNAGAVVVAR